MLVQKSPSTAYFWLLSSGWLGGHHFYLRDPILGGLSVMLCWTGLPLLAAILELPTLHRRVRRLNRLLRADYHGRVDGWDLPAPSCARCHRNIAWVILHSQGGSISRNHQLLRLTAPWWRHSGLLHPAYRDPHAGDHLCPSCTGEITPVVSQNVPPGRNNALTPPSPLLIGALLLAALWMLVHGMGGALQHTYALYSHWQTTPGVVTYNAVDMLTHHTPSWLGQNVTYQPQVQFRYVWENQRWSMGGLLAQAPPNFSSRARAEHYLRRYYPIGQVIEARVNPDDPEQAYALVRPLYHPLWVIAGISSLFLALHLGRRRRRLLKLQ
ncbi:DUF3592 domain-containing protein [Magnetococcus marinus]|nr:DUF3592 domain-containing protein [Magnetococcus marinus]